ncbi:MAG TPA: hypothetical protein VJ837_00375, partial [Candidatus Paceibacterota bacterium]|nr:hypothetical protein [Candidatus Paceibacterota bacterium]
MRLPVGLPLLLLGVAVGSRDAAPESLGSEPCTEIADYLSEFSARNPELTGDIGRAEFLAAAINFSFEQVKSKGLIVEALQPREFETTSKAVRTLGEPFADPDIEEQLSTGNLSGRYLYDARRLGGFVALNDIQGTMHCSYGFLLMSKQDGLHLGPILENEGGQICWDSTFEVIRVGQRAFPAVVSRDTYFRSMEYHLDLLPIDRGPMNVDRPLCRVSVRYLPEFSIAEWYVAPEITQEESDRLRSRLEPILVNLAAHTYVRPSLDTDEGVLSESFLREYDDHGLSTDADVPFAAEHNNAYTQLAGTRSPIKLDGKDY